jgi:hypothetical protein
MGLNFPAAPLVGDVYPTPALPGVPQWTWNGVSWKCGTIDTANYLLKSGGTMTGPLVLPGNPSAALEAAPRQYVDAMALAYNGIQLNGSFEVAQETAQGNPIAIGAYVCDCWRLGGSTGITGYSQRLGFFPGLTSQFSVTVQTARPTLAAAEYCQILHMIEGYRIARLGWGTANAQPLTVAFWCAHNRAGTYSVSAQNGGVTRSCAVTYTQNVASTPEYKVVTIPGCPDGTWDVVNGIGMVVNFCLGSGTTYTAPSAGVWHPSNYICAPGQINGIAATSDAGRLGGVLILPGSYGPSADRSTYLQRPLTDELAACMRYWEGGGAYASYPSGTYFNMDYKVPKRIAATVNLGALAGIAINASGTYGFHFTTTSGVVGFNYTANARL